MAAADIAEIQRLLAGQDHEGIVAHCNKLIGAGKSVRNVLQSKIAACLHCNKYQEAIDACGKDEAFLFEKAYALYKLDRLDDSWTALQAIQTSSVDAESIGHLKAQVLYRQSRYSQAVEHYEKLLKSMQDAPPEDLWDAQLNMIASLVSAGRADTVLSSALLKGSVHAVTEGRAVAEGLHYELIYNVACALLDADRPAAAATALEIALSSGARSLSQDHGSTPAEVAEELSPLRAQAALLLQEAGYEAAAVAVYSSMGGTLAGGAHKRAGAGAGKAVADPTLAVAVSNLAGLHGRGMELVEGYQRIAEVLEKETAAKLTRRQMLTLRFNRALLALSLGRYAEVETLLSALQVDMAGSGGGAEGEAGMPPYLARLSDSMLALNVALEHVKARSGGDAAAGTAHALATSLHAIEARARTHLSPVAAAHAQLLLSQGKPVAAAESLKLHAARISSARPPQLPLHPAVATTVAQLFMAGGEQKQAAEALAVCAQEWTQAAAAAVSALDKSWSCTCACAAIHAHASLLERQGQLVEAGSALAALQSAVVGASPQQRAAAAASLAVIRMAQAGSSGVSAASQASLTSEARALLETAASSAGAQALAHTSGSTVAGLEWEIPGMAGRASKASKRRGGDVATTDVTVATAPSSTVLAVAKLDAKRKRAKAKRAKRRVAYMARLKESGRFDHIGIPRPDPERWIAKRDRKGAGKGRRGHAGGKGTVGGYGHQGGGDEKVVLALDARARAEKEKAAVAAGDKDKAVSPAAVSPTTPTPTGKSKSTGGGKGGKGRR